MEIWRGRYERKAREERGEEMLYGFALLYLLLLLLLLLLFGSKERGMNDFLK